MNVFDIVKEYDQILYEIEELGGELTPELAEALAINEQNVKEKVRAFYFIIKTKEAEIQLSKDEIARLVDKNKVKDNVIKRIKNLTDLAIETFGVVKPKAKSKSLDLGDLSVYQKKTEALELIEGAEIDDDRFCKKHITIELTYDEFEEVFPEIHELILNATEGKVEVETILNKNLLKEWLIEQGEIKKQPKLDFGDGATVAEAFENNEAATKPLTADEKIHLVAKIKHNSSPVFK